MNPAISVIVPVYKVEQYLPRCVESLLAQTYKDFEVILVDDGSPDGCPALCDGYAEKYENIRAIHKENGGQADARNLGVKEARGRYINFVDSDDYVHPLYLEMLVQGIAKTSADISIVGYREVYDGNGTNRISPDDVKTNTVTAEDALLEMLYQKFHDASPWAMLLPYQVARDYPFPVGKLYEDFFVTYKYYLAVHRVSLVRVPLYYYFQREGSTMRRREDQFIFDLIEASDMVVKDCRRDGRLEKAARSKQFSNYCRIIALVPGLEERFPGVYQKLKKTLLSERLSILLDPHTRLKNKAAAAALFFGVGGLRKLYRIKE